MNEWQLIETAPKDGTRIIAAGKALPSLVKDGDRGSVAWDSSERFTEDFICIIHWVEGWYDALIEVGDGLFRKERTQTYAYWSPHQCQFSPEYWMPLPGLPAEIECADKVSC